MSEQVEQSPTAAFVRPFDQNDVIALAELPVYSHILWGMVEGVFAWKSAKEGKN